MNDEISRLIETRVKSRLKVLTQGDPKPIEGGPGPGGVCAPLSEAVACWVDCACWGQIAGAGPHSFSVIL